MSKVSTINRVSTFNRIAAWAGLTPRRLVTALLMALLATFAAGSAYAQADGNRAADGHGHAHAEHVHQGDPANEPPLPAAAVHIAPLGGGASLNLQSVGDGRFEGIFVISNEGEKPLKITGVYARTSPTDPRLPGGLSVSPGKLPVVLPASSSLEVSVAWSSNATKAEELYGHVLVETDALGPHGRPARPSAIGIHAEAQGFLGAHILSIMAFLPLLGLIAIFIAHLMGYKKDENIRWLTLGLQGVNLLLAMWLYNAFDASFLKGDGNEGFQFVERVVWIRSLNIEYYVGIDGISVTMVLLTALISFIGVICSWSVTKQLKGYFAMYNLLVVGMFGTFIALDLMLFFVFWELMLLPMYFLIGVWGGPRRQYAAIKFFIYTLAGSVFMLLSFIFFYLNGDPTYLVDGQAVTHTMAIPELARVAWSSKGLFILGMSAVKVVWVWMFIGFAIKIPMFPFHTWLPDAHVEAPTAISVILAGVLLKMGTYGILRINFAILPEATRWAAPAMAVFGVIGILYGAFCAMAQNDLKKLVAYSSISHMGFTLLAMGALTPQGIQACLVQMFNHGLITAMLFSLVGVVYDRVHTRDIDKFGGLASEMPLYSAFMGFAFMASLGLPGLSGFWGEAMTFIGAFPRYRLLTVLAATGVIITAAYHLWALQRMFFGKFREEWRENKYLKEFGGKFPEINNRELAGLVPLAVLVLVLGFWPRPLLNLIDKGSLQLHRMVDSPGPTQISSGLSESSQRLAALGVEVPELSPPDAASQRNATTKQDDEMPSDGETKAP